MINLTLPTLPSAIPLNVVAFDTETTVTDGSTPALVCLTLAAVDGSPLAARFLAVLRPDVDVFGSTSGVFWALVHAKAPILPAILAILDDPLVVPVAHNLGFDWNVLHAATGRADYGGLTWGIFERGSDTMIRETLLQVATGIESRVNLATCVKNHFPAFDISADKNGEDSWRMKYVELINTPVTLWPVEAAHYAIQDAALTLALWGAQGNVAGGMDYLDKTAPYLHDEPRHVRAGIALSFSASRGIATDQPAVEALDRSLDEAIAAKDVSARQAGIVRVNKCKACDGTGYTGAVPNLVSCAICQGDPLFLPPRARVPLGAPSAHTDRIRSWVQWGADESGTPVLRTDSGAVSTSAEAVESIPHILFETYRVGKQAEKIRSTYVSALRGGMLHPFIRVLLATGRTSYSGPNLQNLPRLDTVRECVIPHDPIHNCFVSCDYSSVELVTLAQIVGPGKLRDGINAGMDPHLQTAALILGRPYDEVKVAYKAGESWAKDWRQRAKAMNFGLPGGLGARTFMQYAKNYGVNLTLNESYDMIASWFQARPEVQQYLDHWGDAIATEMRVFGGETITVRQPGSGRLRGNCGYSQAANTGFQGLAADGIKLAIAEHFRRSFTPSDALFGTRLTVMIHDELLLEGPRETLGTWSAALESVMLQGMQTMTPDVKVSAEAVAMARWRKTAKRLIDPAGRLVVDE